MMQETYKFILFAFILWVLYRIISEFIYLLNQYTSYKASQWNIEIESKARELEKDQEPEEYQSTQCIGFQVDSTTDYDMPEEE